MSGVRPHGRFPARQRLRKRRQFERAQADGKRIVSRNFVFLLCPSEISTAACCRVGVTASRRVGKAVTRNRAKRVVREAFRATREHWPHGVDAVVIVKGSLNDVKVASVVEEWLRVMPRLAEVAQALRMRTEDSKRDG